MGILIKVGNGIVFQSDNFLWEICMEIKKIWQEMFEYWRKNERCCYECKGAIDEELNELKASIQVPIPLDLVESLKCCNSYPKDYSNIDKSCCLLIGKCSSMYNTKEIVETYKMSVAYDFFQDVNIIPIMNWNGDIHICISAIDGKIYYYDLEFLITKKVFDNYKAFLAHIKDKYIESKSGDVVEASDINLTGKVKAIFTANVDAVAVFKRESNKGFLVFENMGSTIAGSRYPHLHGKILISESDENLDVTTYWEKIFPSINN